MMDKKRFLIAIFLFLPLIIMLSSFAQTYGTCINLQNQESDDDCVSMLQSDCAATGIGYDFRTKSLGELQVAGGDCEKVCDVCRIPGGTDTREVWEPRIIACKNQGLFKQLYLVDNTKNENTCNYANTGTVGGLASVEGVVKQNNQNVNGATVWCVGKTTTTDANGYYLLDGCTEKGTSTIRASKGTSTGQTSVYLIAGEKVTAQNINLVSAGLASVQINVTNSTGKPVVGAEVTINSGIYSSTQQTGTQGFTNFFTDVPVGQLTVRTSKSGITQTDYFSVASAGQYKFSVILQSKPVVQISGKVYNGSVSGNTVPGAIINVSHYVGTAKVSDIGTVSNADGSYSFSIASGDYVVDARKTGFGLFSESYNLIQDNSNFNIILPSGISAAGTSKLKVRALTTDGVPIRDVLIQIRNTNSAYNLDERSDANGEFTFNLPTDRVYTVILNHIDFVREIRTKTLSEDYTLEVRMTPIKRIWISGKIVDADTGVAIADSSVFLTPQSYSTTNGNFNFQIRQPAQTLILYAKATGYETKTIEIPKDTSTNVNLGNIGLSKSNCINPSNIKAPNITTAVRNGLDIALDWSVSCSPDTLKLIRSDKTDPIYSTQDSSVSNYVDKNIPTAVSGAIMLCYALEATYYSIGPNEITLSSTPKCITIGPPECQDEDKKFCEGNTQVECKNGERIETPCNYENHEGYVCMEKVSGVLSTKADTECVQQRQCSKCNRPFGLFSESINQYLLFGGKGFQDYSPLFSYIQNSNLFNTQLFLCSDPNIPCYSDYSNTVVDKNWGCEGIHSCYDYVSETACDNNKCLKSQSCIFEKSPSYYDEFGIGVCKPDDVKEQDCNKFNSRKDFVNNVFASGNSTIGREICSLYGDDCYFKAEGERTLCLNKNEVSCNDYGYNREDCVGPNRNSDFEQQVDVDVSWQTKLDLMEDCYGSLCDTYYKVGGTNEIITNSTDYFKIGICKFTEGSCKRDADDNEGLFVEGGISDDCSNSEDRACLLDTAHPITTIDARKFTNSINFDYDVVDSLSSKQEAKTWYSIVDVDSIGLAGIYTYPRQTIGSNYKILFSSPTDKTYTYRIFYFSEDRAHNLEPVKSIDVTVDNINPETALERSIVPDLANGKLDLTLTVSLPANRKDNSINDETAFCINDAQTGLFKLVDVNNQVLSTPQKIDAVESTFGNSLQKTWSATYTNLRTRGTTADGIVVEYRWKCFDRAGNLATFGETSCEKGYCSKQMTLDADTTIHNPVPKESAIKNRNDIGISIETDYPGECRYKTTPMHTQQEYDAGKPFATDDGYHHTATESIADTNVQHVTFYVACILEGIEGIVSGNSPSDDIDITIDDKGPHTIVNATGIVTNENILWVRGSTIKLVCEDFKQNYIPPEIGCGKVYYCKGEGCDPSQTYSAYTAVPSITESTVLRFYSEDNLQNTEENSPKLRTVNFDNIAPIITLEAPLDVSWMQTRSPTINAVMNVTNRGPGNCMSSQTCKVSPLLPDGTYYKILVNGVQVRNYTYDISTDLEPDAVDGIFQRTTTIPLELNKVNTIIFVSRDKAGNDLPVTKTVVQDSLGPNLTNAKYWKDSISELKNLAVDAQYGTDLIVRVTDLVDYIPGTLQGDSNRVDSVWAIDMFGSRYKFTFDNNGGWVTTLPTSSWLVTSPDFQTYILVYANDTLGNIAVPQQVNFTIADTTPPTATIKLENKYGEALPGLIGGMNYIVLTASEPLSEIPNLYFTVSNGGTKQFNTTFIVRDYDAITWIGIVNVSDGCAGTAYTAGSSMVDLNRVRSSTDTSAAFYPDRYPIKCQGFTAPNPVPAVYDSRTGAYNITTSNPTYNTVPGYVYSYIINGKARDSPVFEPGMNDVLIRVQDSDRNYEVFAQKVFLPGVSTKTPRAAPMQAIGQLIFGEGENVMNISGVWTTNHLTISIRGGYAPETGLTAYVIGEDKKKYPADLSTSSPYVFTIPGIDLVGRTFTETPNNLNLIFEDKDGNIVQKNTVIVKDLQPPNLIRLNFTRKGI